MPATNVNIDNLILDKLDYVHSYAENGACVVFLEDMQSVNTNTGVEKTAINGKNNVKVRDVIKSSTFTISGTHAFISTNLLRAQTGGTATTSDTTEVKLPELIVVNGATCVTNQTAIGDVGNEIGWLYIRTPNGGLSDTKYAQGSTADATHFAYDPTTKTITLPVDGATAVIPNKTTIVVFYTYQTPGKKIDVPDCPEGAIYPTYFDFLAKEKCGNVVRHLQIFAPRFQYSPEATLDIKGGEQTVHNFSGEALGGGCDGNSDMKYSFIAY